MNTEFEREEHYIVFKLSDVEDRFTPGEKQQLARLVEVQRVGREEAGKAPLECVVVESDWPEYEPTWNAIEARMTGAQPTPSDEYVGWYCAHCERGVDASEVTYHEQHTVCGRIITDDRPPKSAPSIPEVDALRAASNNDKEITPLERRCYLMSETHLSGYRLIIGFESLEGCDNAHNFLIRHYPKLKTTEAKP